MTTATFSYRDWTLRYPQFLTTATFVSEPLACMYFAEAGLYCANDDCAMIPADPITFGPRISILYALTAHIAAINGASQTGANGLVGRISDASEGSVSVKLDLGALPGSASWFAQTSFGLQAWQMMAPYRTAHYRPSPGRFAQIPGGAFGGRYGYGARRW